MKIFSDRIISRRQAAAKNHLHRILQKNEILLVFSGDPQVRPGGLDQTYPFLPQPDYYWLTGSRRPWGVIAYSLDYGWVDFRKPVTFEEILWEGEAEFEMKGFLNVDSLNDFLVKNKFESIFCLGNPSVALKFKLNTDEQKNLEIIEAVHRARRPKDDEEIQLIHKSALAASAGYKLLNQTIRPGMTERQFQIEYEAEVLRAGAEKFPYDSIFGSGPRSAILHAIPTDRMLQKDELLLIDAGADYSDYCVDITRTFAASGKFTSQQKEIQQIVHEAQDAGIKNCRPGIQWKDVHECAARIIAEGLYRLGILKCSADEAIANEAVSVFFPHGIGHMVGQRVRDVGGDITRPPVYSAGVRLRVNLQLEENFVMTVEPGIYFIPTKFDHAEIRKKYSDVIDWNVIELWRHFGGYRKEDDILVRPAGAENLTGFI